MIVKNLFKKETNIEIFNRMKVELSNGETGYQIITRHTVYANKELYLVCPPGCFWPLHPVRLSEISSFFTADLNAHFKQHIKNWSEFENSRFQRRLKIRFKNSL